MTTRTIGAECELLSALPRPDDPVRGGMVAVADHLSCEPRPAAVEAQAGREDVAA